MSEKAEMRKAKEERQRRGDELASRRKGEKGRKSQPKITSWVKKVKNRHTIDVEEEMERCKESRKGNKEKGGRELLIRPCRSFEQGRYGAKKRRGREEGVLMLPVIHVLGTD